MNFESHIDQRLKVLKVISARDSKELLIEAAFVYCPTCANYFVVDVKFAVSEDDYNAKCRWCKSKYNTGTIPFSWRAIT